MGRRRSGGIVLGLAVAVTAGCADLLVNLLTQASGDLGEMAVSATLSTNLYPAALDLAETTSDKGPWPDGANMLQVRFLKRSAGVGMFKPDGEVGYLDKAGHLVPFPTVTGGVYVAMLPAADKAPKTIVATTSTGQRAAFRLTAVEPITIRAINGKTKDATWDPSRDLTLDLTVPKGATRMRLGAVVVQAGIRTMTTLGFFRPQAHMVIPKEVLKHIPNSASAVGFASIAKGPNWLLVERYEESLSNPKPVGALQTISQAWDGRPLTITGDTPWALNGYRAAAQLPTAGGPVQVAVDTPNAALARPLKPGLTFALAGMRLTGRLFKQTKSESSSTYGGVRYTTTTTTTWKFPELPDATWDALMTDVYGGLRGVFKARGVELLPPSRLAKSPSYQTMEIPPSAETGSLLERSYPGARSVFPGLFATFSSTFAADRPNARIARESGVDGLVTVDLDLQIAGKQGEPDKVVLVPNAYVMLNGATNGWQSTLDYGAIRLDYADGVPFNAQAVRSVAGLAAAVRKGDLLQGVAHGLGLLKEKQESEGYGRIWALSAT